MTISVRRLFYGGAIIRIGFCALGVLGLSFLLMGARDWTPDPGVAFRLVYTGKLDGEIEPCG